MYEQALRLSYCTTMDALEKQVKCLLAAKNALSLVITGWKWVVKPVVGEPDVVLEIPPPADSQNEVTIPYFDTQPYRFRYNKHFSLHFLLHSRKPQFSPTVKKWNLFPLKH